MFSETSLWGQNIGKTQRFLTRFLVTTEGGGGEGVGSGFGFISSSPLNLGPSWRSGAHRFPSWRRDYDAKDREVPTSMASCVLRSFSYGQNSYSSSESHTSGCLPRLQWHLFTESPTPGRDNVALPFLVPNPFKQARVNVCVRVDYEDACVLEIWDLGGYQAWFTVEGC